MQRVGNMQLDANDEFYNQELIDLEDKVLFVGGKLFNACGLPAGKSRCP